MGEARRLLFLRDWFIQFNRSDHPVRRRTFAESVTHEVEAPYRSGAGVSIRVTRRWTVVVGRWSTSTDDVMLQLRRALGGRALLCSGEEIGEW